MANHGCTLFTGSSPSRVSQKVENDASVFSFYSHAQPTTMASMSNRCRMEIFHATGDYF